MNQSECGTNDIASSVPFILLASDSRRGAEQLHRSLQQEGFTVQLASGYSDLEDHNFERETPQRCHHIRMVLSCSKSPICNRLKLPSTVAMRLKRRNASQFVGYIVDPILHTSGLAGDAVFPRSPHHLPQALHDFFRDGSAAFAIVAP